MEDNTTQSQQPQDEASQDSPQSVVQKQTVEINPEQPLEPSPPPKKKRWILSVMVGIFVLLAGISGYLVYQNLQQKEEQALQTQVTPFPTVKNPTRGQELIVDWKTYTNTKYYYTVKHPSTWRVKENNNISYDFVSFLPPDISVNDSTGTVGIKAEKISTQVKTDADALRRFQDFMGSCSSQTPTQCTQKNSDDYQLEKQITIAGKTAFQTYGGCCMDVGRHVFLYHNTNSYRFTLYDTESSKSNLNNENVFNQILSTFKFTK